MDKDKIIEELKQQVKSLEEVIALNQKEKELIEKEHNLTVKSLVKDIEKLKVDNTYMPLNDGNSGALVGNVDGKKFKDMSYQERLEIYNKNKKLYKELTNK